MLTQDYNLESLKQLIVSAGFEHLECVILNMCSTHLLGEQLIAVGCSNVVAWDGNTTDQACENLSDGFYRGFRQCKPYSSCFKLGNVLV